MTTENKVKVSFITRLKVLYLKSKITVFFWYWYKHQKKYDYNDFNYRFNRCVNNAYSSLPNGKNVDLNKTKFKDLRLYLKTLRNDLKQAYK